MLRQANELSGYKLEAMDGAIGTVKEFYFEDNTWAVRYLVAETGDWLTDRGVLISPYALDTPNKASKLIPVFLTKKQIEGSPSLDSDRPVSGQFETNYYPYYNWPAYWGGSAMWGNISHPSGALDGWSEASREREDEDPHLRSTHVVTGYDIEALDGHIGHISDFVIDDETWAIRYLVVDTGNWWPGKKVLLSVQWITGVSWEKSHVEMRLTRDEIKLAPEYSEDELVTRDYEEKLHRFYNRKGYWAEELAHTSVR